MFRFCVPCLLGLEGLIADELRNIGASEVNAENGRVLFSGDEHILEQFGNGDVVVDEAQSAAVQQTDGPPLEGVVHIVQLRVAVDGGNHRRAAEQLDQQTSYVCLCTVAVNDVRLFLSNQLDEPIIIVGDEPGKESGGFDAYLLG